MKRFKIDKTIEIIPFLKVLIQKDRGFRNRVDLTIVRIHVIVKTFAKKDEVINFN
jgi:hypothetical protein